MGRLSFNARCREPKRPKRLVPWQIEVLKGGSNYETVDRNLYPFPRGLITTRIG